MKISCDERPVILRHVVVAIAPTEQDPTFDIEERVILARGVLADLKNIEVVGYSGLTVEFAGKTILFRGSACLRAVSDFEFEFQLATWGGTWSPTSRPCSWCPRNSSPLFPRPWYARSPCFGGNISHFVHPLVEAAFKRRLKKG